MKFSSPYMFLLTILIVVLVFSIISGSQSQKESFIGLEDVNMNSQYHREELNIASANANANASRAADIVSFRTEALAAAQEEAAAANAAAAVLNPTTFPPTTFPPNEPELTISNPTKSSILVNNISNNNEHADSCGIIPSGLLPCENTNIQSEIAALLTHKLSGKYPGKYPDYIDYANQQLTCRGEKCRQISDL